MNETEMNMLNLSDLGKGDIPAISPAFGQALAEAGGVCLESQGHAVGTRLTVRGYRDNDYALVWPRITAQSRRSWNDPENATEHGAVGIAILIAKAEIGYSVIEASRRGTGFDYWLGEKPAGAKVPDESLVYKAGLEISGIRKGDDQIIRARVREKLQQADRVDHPQLEIYVIVVEFGRPLAEVKKNECP